MITGLRFTSIYPPWDVDLTREQLVGLFGASIGGALPIGSDSEIERNKVAEALQTPASFPMTPEEHARLFFFFMIGSVLCCHGGDRIPTRYASCLRDLGDLSRYSWGGVAYACLMRSVGAYSRSQSSGAGICGFYRVLDVWIFEHFPHLGVTSSAPLQFPVMARWAKKKTKFPDGYSIETLRGKMKSIDHDRTIPDPWGILIRYERHIIACHLTRQRVLFEAPRYWFWYLGERAPGITRENR